MVQMKNVGQALVWGKQQLKAQEIPSWALDAELLLMHVTGFSRAALFTKDDYCLPDEDLIKYEEFIRRRIAFEPVQYILNHVEFMGLDFYVDKNVLIPRGDTECLVEAAVKYMNAFEGNLKALDMCTGSGCIGISAAHYCQDIHVTASDISTKVLAIARKNAITNGVSQCMAFIESDMFLNMPPGRYDVLLSNPPYISGKDMKGLQKNVVAYEPERALDGGADGLDFYRIIAENAERYLNPGARIFLEIGWDQKQAVTAIFESQGYFCEEALKDFAGLDRVLIFSNNKGK